MDELVDDLRGQLRSLTKDNSQLKNKVLPVGQDAI